MTQIITDLQIHSKYARAVSPEMVVPKIAEWAVKKGIGVVATGDWTHPLWLRELKMNLEEDETGLLKLNSKIQAQSTNGLKPETSNLTPKFLLSGEVSCIYSQGGKVRRIHTLIFAPDFATVDKINAELSRRGCNLMSDGRPIIGLSSIQLAEVVFGISQDCLVIPAHAYTPWFSLFGSMSGFDSIQEAFGPYASKIYAVETGLSSDPAMNWRIKELDNRSIVSFSDAHSGPKLGREATVFDLEELSFKAISEAIRGVRCQVSGVSSNTDNLKPETSNLKPNKIAYTIEFHPEEGKYHYTGHRTCNIRHSPSETKKLGTICPVCGKPLTVGVMHRVEDLAGRSEEDLQLGKVEMAGTKVQGVYSQAFPNRPPYVMLVPLQEIIAESMGTVPTSLKVITEYNKLAGLQQKFGDLTGEFGILLSAEIDEITKIFNEKVAEGVDKVRKGNIVIEPGYDGVFGVVKIWQDEEKTDKKMEDMKKLNEKEQMSLF